MWTVVTIDEVDDDSEERYPGEPLIRLVTIENDYGSRCQLECAENWLIFQDIHEGDEWPEDIEQIESSAERLTNMAEFMNNYYDQLEEMDADGNKAVAEGSSNDADANHTHSGDS